jgi:hypothetical protein
MTAFLQSRFDLGACTVDEHKLHTQRREQIQVVREIEEAPIGDEIAAECNDKDLSTKSMDVGSDRLEPVDEPVLARKPLPPQGLRAFVGSPASGFLVFVV